MLTMLKLGRWSDYSVKKLIPWVLIPLGLLLTGCINLETEITFYEGEQWQGTQAVVLNSQLVQLMESGGEEFTEFTELTEEIDEARAAAESENLNFTFSEERRDDGSLAITVQGTGQGLDDLNDFFFENQAQFSVDTVNGQRQITIRQVYTDTQELAEFGGSLILRITGSEIISSNADEVDGGTAFWQNPNEVQVTINEVPGAPPPLSQDMGSTAPSEQESESTDISSLVGETDDSQQTEPSPETSEAEPSEQELVSSEAEVQSEHDESLPPGEAESEQVEPSEPTTETQEDTAATTPAQESDSLPQAGAVLTKDSATSVLAVGGLLLIILGVGAVRGLLRRQE